MGTYLQTEFSTGQKTSNINYDTKRHRVTLDFHEEIPQSKNVVLEISFSGTINSDMAGFYRSKYKSKNQPAKSVPKEGEFDVMFSTQFEACDARRAFPCFDEPNLKASFDVSIEIPEDLTALSNMPEKETIKASKPGFKTVSFQRTPKMSTYVSFMFSLPFASLTSFAWLTHDGCISVSLLDEELLVFSSCTSGV